MVKQELINTPFEKFGKENKKNQGEITHVTPKGKIQMGENKAHIAFHGKTTSHKLVIQTKTLFKKSFCWLTNF